MSRLRIKSYRKRIVIWGVVASVAMIGCGQTSPISEKNEELVAEYAAGVLMRYSASETGQGLQDKRNIPDESTEPTTPVVRDEDTKDITDHSGETPVVEAQGVENVGGGVDDRPASIAAAIGIPEFDVSYRGYEIADIYPDQKSDSMGFSMQAAAGKELLVAHFDVTNNNAEARDCDVLSYNVKFRILINGEKRVNEQLTILLNDLKSYSESVAAGETKDTVLVFEIDKGESASINSLSLIAVGAAGEESFVLQ